MFSRYLAAIVTVFAGSTLAQPVPGDIIFTESFDDFALGEDVTTLPNGWLHFLAQPPIAGRHSS